MSVKMILRISLVLNLALIAGGVTFMLVRKHETVTARLIPQAKQPGVSTIVLPPAPPAEIVTQPFQWSDLESSNGYRGFISRLRAVGCPETSIADIVRGNVDRAFLWERYRLHLDGSGNGPWSQASEIALINDLMGNSGVPRAGFYSQNAGARLGEVSQVAPQQGAGNMPQGNSQVAQLFSPQSYSQSASTPQSSWLAQGGTWNNNAGLTAGASANQSSGGQSQQSDAMGGSQQNSDGGPQMGGDPNSPHGQGSGPESSSNGHASSDDPFTKSAQDIMAEQLNQYYDWYEPQVVQATANGTPLFINPDAFHP